MSGNATDPDFTSAVIATRASAATTAGLAVSGQTATSVTLTWDASDSNSINVDLTAFNDQLVDSGETLTLTLSGESATNGSAALVAGQSAASLTITDIDSDVTFAITSTSEAVGNDTPTQSATISEENLSDNTGTFTISKGGDALTGTNTASVTVTMSGNATDPDFTSAVIATVASAATTAGLAVSGQTATSVTLTWDASDSNSINVDLTAFNDQLVDSGETLTLTLSGESATNGSAALVAGQSAASLTITDIDSDVTFAITSTSEAVGNDTPTQSATISEENLSDNTGTFTISKGGDALTGTNTASVTVTMSGNATDPDFTSAVIATVASAATTAGLAVSGQTATSVTLTWDASDSNSINVDLTAFNDQLVDSGETLTLTLSGESATNGSAALVAGQSAASLTITDIDSDVTFAITSTSEAVGNDTPTQSATISEENLSDNTGTFTISKGGDALTGTNTASVTVTMSGNATDPDFTSAVIATVASAATTAGLAVSGQTATSVTLTWDASDSNSINVDLTAFNDQLVDSGETLTLTLSGESATNGSAALVAGQSAASLTITDIDSDVTFAITSTSEAVGNDTPTQSATISEENLSDNTGTFTISKGGDALTGTNTASVTVTMSGNATDPDFTSAVIATVASAATTAGLAVSGQTATSVTLTWDASDSNSINVDLTAFNDQLVDSGETLTLTLSGESATN